MATIDYDNSDLAAALFCTLGLKLPHRHDKESEAEKLAFSIASREKRLLKVIELCGTPTTPKQLYIITKAYSWLGSKYRKEIIHYASEYLNTDGWSELPHKTVVEDGISMNQTASQRASVLVDLAQAQEGEGNYEAALSNFMEAYRLEPYNAMNVIKAADVIAKSRSKEEALSFLRNQHSANYYMPVKYTDLRGNRCINDTFKQLIHAHLLKLQESEQTSW